MAGDDPAERDAAPDGGIPEPVAHVLVRDQSGVFVAHVCDLEAGVVTASGRWRNRDQSGYRWGRAGTYSWPAHRLHEVRWFKEPRRRP